MSIGSPIPGTNIKLHDSMQLEYNFGSSGDRLSYYNGWRIWKKYVGYNASTTVGSSDISMAAFYGGTRSPYFRCSSGTYTLNSNSVLGQPAGWSTGHVLKGYSNYGYDSSGGVFVGSITDGIDAIYTPFSPQRFVSLRQALWNTTNGTYMIRLSNPYDYPLSTDIYYAFIYYGTSGSSFTSAYNLSSTYTELAGSSDYTRVFYYANGPSDFGSSFRLMLSQGIAIN